MIRSYLLSLPLVFVTMACGGGLSHTVDDASVASLSGDQKAGLEATEQAVAQAETKSTSAEKAAETSVEDVASAEKAVTSAERALELAQAKLAYQEARRAYLEQQREEAKTALVVARARHELAKLNAVGQSDEESKSDHAARVAQFEAQLAEAEADHAEAKQASAERKQAMHEAQGEIEDV